MVKDTISFEKLEEEDLVQLHKWLSTEHVNVWYTKKNMTLTEVKSKYLPRIQGVVPVYCSFFYIGNKAAGFIQAYKISSFPVYEQKLRLGKDAVGIDLFIGEKDFLYQGYGEHILREFLNSIVHPLFNIELAVIAPQPENKNAIKCYEKTGFRYDKTVEIDKGEFEYIMLMEIVK